MRAVVLVLALAGALSACRQASGRRAGPELSLQWMGERWATFRAPARAVVCAETGIVELLAVRGDSGAGIVFFPADSSTLPSGEYRIFVPTLSLEPRPGAMASVRWFDEGFVRAFYATGGTVRVDGGRQVAGSFEVAMQQHDGNDTARVTGRFARVRLEEAPAGCGLTSRRDYL
jgi:hypothetical protein